MTQCLLSELYQDLWVKLNAALPKDRGISNPLLIRVPDAYETARLKLVVVGKETHGWISHLGDPKYPTSPEELIQDYGKFNLGENYLKSPFWWAAHQLQHKLEPSVPPFGFVWTNLFICDQNQTTPEDDIADKLRELSVLKDEMKILRPDAVVFFTGWTLYDYTLKKIFPGIVLTPADRSDGKLLCRLSHPSLPFNSYRTFHPKHLRLRGKMSVLDTIVEMITSPSQT